MPAAPATTGLYNVTIRRTYTEAHRDKWGGPEYSDSTHPEWATSAEALVATWADIHDNQSPYWLEKFRDEVLLVEPLNVDAQRAHARQHPLADERCCDLAVVNPCVCSISFTCPEHGAKHIGTHD